MVFDGGGDDSSAAASEELSVKVVLLGDSGVGKTSLAVRFVQNEFHPFPESTIGTSFLSRTIDVVLSEPAVSPSSSNGEENGERHDDENSSNNNTISNTTRNNNKNTVVSVHLKIWDTAGQERYQSLAPLYFRGAAAAILVFDICRRHSFETLRNCVQDEILQSQMNQNENLIWVVCGNKSDLEEHRSVDHEEAILFATSLNAAAMYFETSARDNRGVEELFQELAHRAATTLSPTEIREDTVMLRTDTSRMMRSPCCNP